MKTRQLIQTLVRKKP